MYKAYKRIQTEFGHTRDYEIGTFGTQVRAHNAIVKSASLDKVRLGDAIPTGNWVTYPIDQKGIMNYQIRKES